eukprot:scaffold4433_cov124-Isochrysis_galbana.AAC.3
MSSLEDLPTSKVIQGNKVDISHSVWKHGSIPILSFMARTGPLLHSSRSASASSVPRLSMMAQSLTIDDKALASRGTPEGATIKLGRQPRATPPGPLVVRWDPV